MPERTCSEVGLAMFRHVFADSYFTLLPPWVETCTNGARAACRRLYVCKGALRAPPPFEVWTGFACLQLVAVRRDAGGSRIVMCVFQDKNEITNTRCFGQAMFGYHVVQVCDIVGYSERLTPTDGSEDLFCARHVAQLEGRLSWVPTYGVRPCRHGHRSWLGRSLFRIHAVLPRSARTCRPVWTNKLLLSRMRRHMAKSLEQNTVSESMFFCRAVGMERAEGRNRHGRRFAPRCGLAALSPEAQPDEINQQQNKEH